jgi:DNA-binding transcriptional MerR regulator
MFDSSIRTLRLYDKMGLFKPAHVDPDSGYRHYTADQLPLLHTILVLKSVGFHLVEIRELVGTGLNAEVLDQRLGQRGDSLEGEIEIARFKLENVQRIRDAVRTQLGRTRETASPEGRMDEAYRLSRLICLENLKVDHTLSEVLWL